MFFDDPVGAFTNVASALVPGGRLCLVTWQPLIANDWLTVPGAALLSLRLASRRRDAAGPGMFAQSEPDLIRHALVGSGYGDVALRPVIVTLTLGADPGEAVEYLADTGPAARCSPPSPTDDKPAALAAVRAGLADHFDGDGVHLDAGIWIVTAVRG